MTVREFVEKYDGDFHTLIGVKVRNQNGDKFTVNFVFSPNEVQLFMIKDENGEEYVVDHLEIGDFEVVE